MTVLLAIRSPATMTPSSSMCRRDGRAHLHAEPSQPSFGRRGQTVRERASTRGPLSIRTMRAESGSIRLNSERRLVRTSDDKRAGHLDPVGPAPTSTNVRRSGAGRILLRLGLLERPEDAVPNRDGVAERLQAGREPLERVVPK
jgi:hypothetical protein